MTLFLSIVFFTFLTSCGASPATPPAGGPLVDLEQPEVRIRETPTTLTSFETPFAFSVDVIGTGTIQRAVIERNVGTVKIGGKEYPAAVYEKQQFGQYDLYQTHIADTDRWWVAWFYCTGDDLYGIYVEGTNGQPMSWEPTLNTKCVIDTSQAHNEVSFPPSRLSVDVEHTGYQIDAKNLSISPDGVGVLTHLGEQWDIQVFEPVDCLTPDCGSPTWHALHSIVTKGDTQCFTIFYLMDDPSKPLQMAWSRCLPDFDNRFGNIYFPGTWTNMP